MDRSLQQFMDRHVDVFEGLELRKLFQSDVELGAGSIVLDGADLIQFLLAQDVLGVVDQLFEGYLVCAVAEDVLGLDNFPCLESHTNRLSSVENDFVDWAVQSNLSSELLERFA